MKKLVVAKKDACMACKACEIACSEAFYKTFDERKSCITISMKKDGTPKPMVCPQCGKCAEACPFGLMVKAEDADTASKCIACGICAKACPMDILEIKED